MPCNKSDNPYNVFPDTYNYDSYNSNIHSFFSNKFAILC